MLESKSKSWRETAELCRADVAAIGFTPSWMPSVMLRAARSPGTRLLLVHRLQQWIGDRWWFAALLSSLVWNLGYILSGCNIGRTAQLAGGVVLPHPVAIVIGNGCSVASGCWIYQSVTLGATEVEGVLSYPTLEPGCRIFPGACVLGPVRVGERTTLGANSVLLHSTSPGSFYVGAPARAVGPDS